MTKKILHTQSYATGNSLMRGAPDPKNYVGIHRQSLRKFMAKFSSIVLVTLLLCLGADVAKAQLTASFTADDTAGCSPLIVNFTNTSSGATGYTWDLGNGTPPFHTTDASGSFPTGTYTVTLTATAGSSSSVYTMVVTAYDPPTVSFNVNDTSICPGVPVKFTSSSVSHAWGGMTYAWFFGDGGFDTATSPSYAYALPGYYDVTLTVTNAPGCSNSLGKTRYMHVFTPATPGFTATPTNFCKAPGLATFTNTTTGKAPISYKWEFGDGSTSTLSNPTHNYTSSGSFNVTLVATDGDGCKDSVVQPGYVNVGSLLAGFTFPSATCFKAPVAFSNTSSFHVSSKWYFGDGNTSTFDSPVYTYGSTGTFSVKLVVFDGTCYDSVTHLVTISALPTGSLSSTPVHPCPPSVNVTYNASVPAGTSVAWLFGDGTTGTGPSIVKNYASPVIDFVDMILTNGAGCKDTVQRIDTIYNLLINPTASATEGCAPLATSFSMYAYSVVYNTFTSGFDFFPYPYAISSYSWNFGDGSPTSSGATPSHTYSLTGVYTATCTITTVNGCTASTPITISVGKPPTPSFTMSKSHICADRSITFTSTSSGPIDAYYWDFGDGTAPPLPPASPTEVHVYTAPGVYSPNLKVSEYGCMSLTGYSLKDTIDSPNAVINYNFACIPSNEIDFKDASLGDDTHLWQFGDGVTSTAFNPVHDYSALLTYSVTLTTYNVASGCRDTSSFLLNLARPSVSFLPATSRLDICRDQIDTFNSNVFGNGSPATRFKWYDNGILIDSTHKNFINTYHVLGLHTITLLITDTHGCLDTFTRPNYLLVAKPTASFSFTPSSGCASLPVTFTDLSTDVAGAPIKKFIWAFGDGLTSTLLGVTSVTHTYTIAGTFAIKEIVIDTFGCSDTLTNPTKLSVYKPAPSFNVSATNVCAHTGIVFTNTSTGITSSLWMFGDGDTSTLTSPVHAYSTSGTYTVKLIVSDAHGCIDTLTRTGFITVNPGPNASFTMNDSFAVCPPLNVHFNNTSTGASTYVWKFGDGNSSFAKSPSEPYSVPGVYTVTLSATNSSSCSDTAIGHVTIFGYKGAFSYAPLKGCSPLRVHFSASLSTVVTIVWDFGDGSISPATLLDTISHYYSAPGQYVPRLILKDTSGCTSFSVGADTIKVDTIVPGFSIVPNPICQNNTVTFTDTSHSLFSASTAWLWTFGGGFTSTLSAPTHIYTAAGSFPVTLQVKNGTGCTSTLTQTVTVNGSPSPISGLTAICAGVTTALTDPAGTGTWISSNTTVATIGSASGLLTGLVPGTSTITFTVPAGCTISEVITVRPLPAIISGATGICFGLSTALSDTSTLGTWSSSNTAVATVGSTTGVVKSISVGTTTITYTLPTGCATTSKIIVAKSPVTITSPPNLCLGVTITVSDTAAGGSWTSSNTTVASIGLYSGTITGLSLGTTTISYSLGTGCTVGTTMTIIPVPSAIKGSPSICAGTVTSLTDPTSGGAWTSTNTLIATVGTGGVVSGVSGGTDTIIYTLPTGCSVSKPIIINSSSPITGLTSVCVGSSASLSDASFGGTWSSSNTSVATIGRTSGTFTGISGGTSVITYMLPSGCFRTIMVSVIAKPDPIIGSSPVCVGQSIILSDATIGGFWVSADNSIATIGTSTGVVSGITSGTVLIYYSIGTGCTQLTTIIVNPISPVTGPSTVCVGQAIVLADTALGGTWSTGTSTVATVGIKSGSVTGVSAGTASITYGLPTGCSASYVVSVMPLPNRITGITSVCAGLLTVLSDATIGGTWTSANTGIASVGSGSGIVTGNSAGVGIISYTYYGCSITTPVTVNPLPSIIKGNTGICLGATTILSDAGGGTWYSSITTVATIDLKRGLVNGLAAGSSTITYTLPTGCIITTSLTVSPLPLTITGNTSVCAGLTTPLTDASPGGVWSSTNTTVATIDPFGVLTGLIPGTSTVIYSVNGCPTGIIVVVDPLPSAITGVNQMCLGLTTSLSDGGGGTWTSSNSSIATIGLTSGVVTGIAPGTDTITYVLPVTGCLTTTTVLVNPLPLPITGTTSICTTLQTTLVDLTATGTWSSSTTTVATIDSNLGLVTGVSPGTTTITFRLSATGCITTTSVLVNPFPTGIMGRTLLCYSTPTTLSDAVKGGTWSSSNTFIATIGLSSGVVTGMSLGTTIITYTIAGACSISGTYTVVPLPTRFNVTGGGSFCAMDTGVHVGLNGSAVGVNYLLYDGGIVATGPKPGTGSAIDFGLQKVGGSYTAVGINTSTGCSNNMLGGVTITALPTVVPSVNVSTGVGDTVCSGVLTKFSALSTNGGILATWIWNVNGTNVGLGNTYSYVPANGDVVSCTMTSDTNCASPVKVMNFQKMTVTLPQLPSVSISADPGDTICQGEKVTLYPHPVYGGSSPVYSWTVNTSTAGSGASFAYLPNKGDVVYCTMKSNFPCLVSNSVSSPSIALVVDSPIIPQVAIVARPGTNIGIGWTDTLTAMVTNGGSSGPAYQWLVNGIPVPGATTNRYISNQFSHNHADSISCSVTSSGLCPMTTHNWVYINVSDVGVKPVALQSNISVLPNPTKGEFVIKGSLGTVDDAEVSIEVTDPLGQIVYRKKVWVLSGNIDESVQLSNTLASSMYILTLHSGVENKVFHIVLER